LGSRRVSFDVTLSRMVSELAPGFLVAAPTLLDPNFYRTVILLIDHRKEGSLGFVVNRPASVTFRGVVEELGLSEQGRPLPELPVLVGGPVAPHTGWIVFDPKNAAASPGEGTISVTDHLRVSASRELLRTIAHAKDTIRHMLVLGYAGWGAGQLDAEIKQGVWIPVDLDEQIIFETPFPQRWNASLATVGIDPLEIVGTKIAEA
jgi:putative transcriptional regulator